MEQNAYYACLMDNGGIFFVMAVEFTNPLESIKIASPCSADWDAMVGNNRERFCGQCKMSVYNLSGMTRYEAENLIMNSEGRLCARFFRRADGTIMTKDCPVGWKAIKRRMSKVWTAFATVVITAFSGIGITTFMTEQSEPDVMGSVAIENTTPTQNHPEPLMGGIAPQQIDEPEMLMGDVAMTPTSDEGMKMGKMIISPK